MDVRDCAYISYVLDAYSQKELMNICQKAYFQKIGKYIPNNWSIKCHHATVVFSPKIADYEKYKKELGTEKDLLISSVAIDEHAIAAIVDNIRTNNAVAHVTIAHSGDVTPVYSNTLLTNKNNDYDLNRDYEIRSYFLMVGKNQNITYPDMRPIPLAHPSITNV